MFDVGLVQPKLPPADAENSTGGAAYGLGPREALARYATTGCLRDGYYQSGKVELATTLELASKCEPTYVAKLAVWARERGHMKDAPALLCASLAPRDPGLFKRVLPRVADQVKQLRNVLTVLRSGALGKKYNLSSRGIRRSVERWLDSRTPTQLFRQSVGGEGMSLPDVLRCCRPRAKGDAERQALYGWLLDAAEAGPGEPLCVVSEQVKLEGEWVDAAEHGYHSAQEAGGSRSIEDRRTRRKHRYRLADLPPLVRDYELWRRDPTRPTPEVDFRMLDCRPMSAEAWLEVARRCSWQTLRHNLNTLARHGAYDLPGAKEVVTARLRDQAAVRGAKVLPFQLLAAWRATEGKLPVEVSLALQDAVEVSVENVPALSGKVYVCVDVSGSMRSPVTGVGSGGAVSASSVRCVDAAALWAAAVLRKNPTAEVLPFEQAVVPLALNPRDSVKTNADRLAAVGGGGTNCSAPLALLNARAARGDVVLFVSDYESWVDSVQPRSWPFAGYGSSGYWSGRSTAVVEEWAKFRARNPGAKMVCLDLVPNRTVQAPDDGSVLNLGGFSDVVWELAVEFLAGTLSPARWVGEVEGVEL